MKTDFSLNETNNDQTQALKKTKNLIDFELSYTEVQDYFKKKNNSINIPKDIEEAAYFIYKMDQLLKDQKEKEKILYLKTISS